MTKKIGRERAYEYLKSSILAQKYSPGQNLIEDTIASELGLSRTPVREALRELSRDGLVETIPNRGAFVRVLSLQDLLDIFDIKILLEGLCANRAALRNGKATAEKLYQSIAAMQQAAANHDRPAYLAADEAYHTAIYQGAKSEMVHHIIQDLNTQWHRMRPGMIALETRMQTAVTEHTRIANAIEQGNPDLAEIEMRLHLTNLRDQIQSLLEDFITPFNGVK
jgi:DNA-binding GntR family transcriptional regulator